MCVEVALNPRSCFLVSPPVRLQFQLDCQHSSSAAYVPSHRAKRGAFRPPQAEYPQVRRGPRDGPRLQPRLSADLPGFRGAHHPQLHRLKARCAGQAGRSRGPEGGVPRGLLAGPNAPRSPQRARGLFTNRTFARAPLGPPTPSASLHPRQRHPGGARAPGGKREKGNLWNHPLCLLPTHLLPQAQAACLRPPSPLLSGETPLRLTPHPSEPRKQQETLGSPEFRSSPVF